MRKKVLTVDCNDCECCIVNDQSQFTCTWGRGKPKIMFPPKGKKTIFCKLKKGE